MTDQQQNKSVFTFVISWMFLIFFLTMINKTRLGHVILYYSLMLMILVIIASEYQNITPFLQFSSISQLDTKLAAGQEAQAEEG